jgi:alpha-aminoadipic semialdehyde synthase
MVRHSGWRIGIRREDKNIWERRAPLIPSHVHDLIRREGLEIMVQPSQIRVFTNQEYENVGAILSDDLSSCPIIIGIKEIPVRLLEHQKVYAFFSHTTKGQHHNRPMLKTLIQNKCTLIDYEKITDDQGRRLVFFGTQAGQAGMIDGFWVYGQKIKLAREIETPFLKIRQACHYGSLVEAKETLRRVGQEIYQYGLPESEVPFICGFLGYGHVSQGAQEIFDLLPTEEIQPEKLAAFYKDRSWSAHRVYKVIFKEEHLVEPLKPSAEFDLQDYYQYPHKYRSRFDAYLPYLTMIINCVYWSPEYPRFVTRENLRSLWEKDKNPRLQAIVDISCDIEGSIEITNRVTTPDNPVYTYQPLTGEYRDGFQPEGITVLAIDNLPAEIPLESSVFFSLALKPFIPALARADYSVPFDKLALPPPLKRAVILHRGEFTPAYRYMEKFIQNITS